MEKDLPWGRLPWAGFGAGGTMVDHGQGKGLIYGSVCIKVQQ